MKKIYVRYKNGRTYLIGEIKNYDNVIILTPMFKNLNKKYGEGGLWFDKQKELRIGLYKTFDKYNDEGKFIIGANESKINKLKELFVKIF